MKTLKKLAIIMAILAIIWILLFYVIRVQDIILKKIFPQEYSQYVYQYSEENQLDPLLVFSIIKAESNFKPDVVSSSKAIGLMQLMEPTAAEIAKKEDYEEYIVKESLYQPEINIKIGTKYFANLLEIYEGNVALALTAYNAGIGNVETWIKNGTIQKDGSDIENIPYKETNNYVRKILRNYKVYEQLYGK